MARYIIDANLPRRFSLWSGGDYEYVVDIDDRLKDSEIWAYARDNVMTIVTKDADFSDLMLMNEPPPRVIHIKLGNLRMREFHQRVSHHWADICAISRDCKLVRVYADRIEGID